jgi:hypothetical protein
MATSGIDPSRQQYVALSHCWGQAMPDAAKSTQATLQHHLAAIQLANLPLTFIDAILLTRALHIPYLWIDSLCIIQDSPTEGGTFSEEELVRLYYTKGALFFFSTDDRLVGCGTCVWVWLCIDLL